MTTSEKQLMIVGIDDSEPSWNALQWTIDHFIIPFGSNSPFKLLIVHVKPTPSSTIGLGGPGTPNFSYSISIFPIFRRLNIDFGNCLKSGTYVLLIYRSRRSFALCGRRSQENCRSCFRKG